jgi:hypothetical protein
MLPLSKGNDIEDMKWVIQKFHLDSKMNEEKAYELIKDAISR